MAHAVLLYDGQLSASLTAIVPTELQSTPNEPRIVTIQFFNTSASLTETVQVYINRQVSGVNRQIGNFVLLPNESEIIANLPVGPGDQVFAISTDASVVDYHVQRSISGGFGFIAMDAYGTSKGVSTLRQMLTALATMIEDWPPDPGVGSYQ